MSIFIFHKTAFFTAITLPVILIACQSEIVGIKHHTPITSVTTEHSTLTPIVTAVIDTETVEPEHLNALTSPPKPQNTVAATKVPSPTQKPGLDYESIKSIPTNPIFIPKRTPEPKPYVAPHSEPPIAQPPDRHLENLGRRLVIGHANTEVIKYPPPLTVGQDVDFWVSRDNGSTNVQGTVSHISENAYWIFEKGYEPDALKIAQVAKRFEIDVWPVITGIFGSPLTPGIDGDARIVIYTAVLREGVAGYFSAADSYTKEIMPKSNEREAIYMSANRVDLTSDEYMSVIAHELQHACHFAIDPGEDSWVNEGLSEVAADLAGFPRSAAPAFAKLPSTSLTAWAQDISISVANYGAAHLFFTFLATHYGDNQIIKAIAAEQKDGIESIDLALTAAGFNVSADDVYADWLIANFLNTNDGRYRYSEHIKFPPIKDHFLQVPDTYTGSVRAYGASYLDINGGLGTISIKLFGDPKTPLLNNPPHSGKQCWWTNQGDSIDSTLTRSIDLRSVDSATLKYWIDYDIEELWDYAYVMISADNGATWNIVETDRSTNSNPNGNAYGPGLTGTSDGWIQDSLDLSNYAGTEILLRLEYITDDAVFSKGACFDDFEIEEIGWYDDTSSNDEWVAEGFVLVNETVPTQYLVQLIHQKNDREPEIFRMPVDAAGRGEFKIEQVEHNDTLVVIISSVNRLTTLPTEYTITVN